MSDKFNVIYYNLPLTYNNLTNISKTIKKNQSHHIFFFNYFEQLNIKDLKQLNVAISQICKELKISLLSPTTISKCVDKYPSLYPMILSELILSSFFSLSYISSSDLFVYDKTLENINFELTKKNINSLVPPSSFIVVGPAAINNLDHLSKIFDPAYNQFLFGVLSNLLNAKPILALADKDYKQIKDNKIASLLPLSLTNQISLSSLLLNYFIEYTNKKISVLNFENNKTIELSCPSK